ncbi:uncharacterized protein LOC122791765 [Protopterus annectens]|uniref:uncharacterized protein LOC122791765 n=1 Tax=Protopterus annectens TaxID=7888 RepID=UPI001CF98C18|nr:uncharacterized protein LOC122791765 [Protopterus annectens]
MVVLGQLIFCLLVSICSTSHMQGGTMSFIPKAKNRNGTVQAIFRFKESFNGACSSKQFNWPCASGKCGNLTTTHFDKIYSDPAASWCQAEGVMEGSVPDTPFSLKESSCCWVSNANKHENLVLLTYVDLGTRSDTGKPNSSPIATIIPILRVAQNCPTTFKLLIYDPDGDKLNCRLATNGECSLCRQHPYFALNQNTCTLSYNTGATTGLHIFELQIEDFPKKTISLTYANGTKVYRQPSGSSPLSKIPLQFLVQVDSSISSCTYGDYRPAFLPQTPSDGAHFIVKPGRLLHLELSAKAVNDRVTNFKISGPANMTSTFAYNNANNVGQANITWTPKEDDMGKDITLCFLAETHSGHQSQLRCVVIITSSIYRSLEKGDADIMCTQNTMTVTVRKSLIKGMDEHHLRLNDPSCLVSSNGTHVIASVSLNSCGTEVEEEGNNIIFKNEITTFDHPNEVITRRHEVQIPFRCSYPKESNTTNAFHTHKKPYLFSEAGFGTFTYVFEFYNSSDFTNKISPSNYPIEVDLREKLFTDIQVQSSISNIQMFVESCRATAHDIPNDPVHYDIINNGCTQDVTVRIYPSNQTEFRFGMEAFTFIGDYEQVYITCTVILCKWGDDHTRCTEGCINGTQSRHRLGKRSIASETQRHFISQGPLRLAKRSLKNITDNNVGLPLNPNVLTIALALVASVALLAGVMIYRTKVPKQVKYESLPSSEF